MVKSTPTRDPPTLGGLIEWSRDCESTTGERSSANIFTTPHSGLASHGYYPGATDVGLFFQTVHDDTGDQVANRDVGKLGSEQQSDHII